jgi:hypothetical protein
MKSPTLLISKLFAFYLIILLSSCALENNDEPSKLVNHVLDEESEGSEDFDDTQYESLEQIFTDEGANLSVSGNILHKITFEEFNPFSLAYNQFCCNHSKSVIVNPLNSKDKVGRIELRDSDRVTTSEVTSARAEILFPSQKNKERWYAVSIFFPEVGYSRDRESEIIMQWHQGKYSPPTSIRVQEDKIFLRAINRNTTTVLDKYYTNYPIGNVERGKWNEFIFHYIHSPYSDGLIEIWFNNQKLNSIKGPNIRSGQDLPRLKLGIYKTAWNNGKTTNTSKRVLFFNNILIGNEDSSLDDLRLSGLSYPDTPASEDADSSNSSIESFSLIDASRDLNLGVIQDGSNFETPTNNLSIIANVSKDFKGKVKFELLGSKSKNQTESVPPFSLFGDDGDGDYYSSGLPDGIYTLKATPVVNNEAGISKTIKFQIKN